MAPALFHHARSILEHALTTRQPDTLNSLGPLATHKFLAARDDTASRPNPESGVLHPNQINNKFMFVLFGLIGAAFICIGIWFFFWARNGGFYFKESDWEDYKSTVLRRKGPNGTTLSGATTETDLGGGSVYKDLDDINTEYDNSTVITGTTGITGITGGVSDIAGRERRRKKREQKEREKERRREEKRREKEEKKRSKGANRKVGADGAVIDEDAEAQAAEYLRNYRHEKPARVGGINKESDASTWDGSTNPTESSRGGYTESTVTSELISHRERTPTTPTTTSPTKKSAGIRKVYSTADKRDSRETERIRAEARKLQEKGRAATASSAGSSSSSAAAGHRRNFSWQRDNRVDEDTPMIPPPPSYSASEVDTRIPGSWAESDVGTSDLGTKSYHHVIPGLTSSSEGGSSAAGGTDVRDYAEEKRKRRSAGYRRER